MATRFFPPASFLHGDDYLEFALRFNIRPADTEYPAAGEKNISQNPAAGKKNNKYWSGKAVRDSQ